MRWGFAVVAAACGTAGTYAYGSQRDAVVYIASNVSEADIYVDGKLIGPVQGLASGIAVDPGLHRIELRHDSYFSRYAELTLRGGQSHRLSLEMVKILP